MNNDSDHHKLHGILPILAGLARRRRAALCFEERPELTTRGLTHTANTTPCTLHGPQWRNDGPPTETDTRPYEAERGGGAA